MPIYEYQGKHYDIDTDDVQVAKSKILATMAPPETAMQTFGRSAASLADTALNAVTGTLDYAAYPLARAYYGMTGNRTPEQAAQLAQQETTSPKDVIGSAFGVKGTPGYENAPLRQLGTAVGQAVGENIIQPAAQATGIPEQDVSNMLNSLAIGAAPVAGRATVATGRAIKAAPAAVRDVAGGTYGALTGKIAKPGAVPEPWQQPSVRQPVSSVYYTPEQIQAWRAGELPTEQLTPQPIQNLGPQAMTALQRTEGNVPYAGQGWRAFGEQLGETYRNPLNLLTDIGLDVLTSGGLPTAGRLAYKGYKGISGAKAAKTLEGAGFTPLYPEELTALKTGAEHPSVIGTVAGPVVPQPSAFGPTPTQPLLPYSPRGQTPMPMAGPGRRVGIEGESYNLPYQIDVSNAQTARPQTLSPAAPATSVKPVAPESLPQAAAEDLERQASKQKIRDMIAAKTNIKPESAAAAESTTPTIADWAKKKTGTESTGTGEKFADTIEQHRQAIIKEKESRNLPAPDITDAAVVKSMIKQTGNGAVTQSGKRVSFNSELYDDLAGQAGVRLDWSTAPDIANLDRASTRTAINDWVYDTIRQQRPDLGLGSRGPQQRTLQAAAERELGITGKESMGAEEISALQQRAAKLLGKKYKPPGTMEMMVPESKMIHNSIEDAAGKIAIEQMTNNNGMFETMYKKGKDTISEVKYPNYHAVEITHPDGSKTIMKKQAGGYSVTDVPPKDKIEYILQKTDKFGIPKVIGRSSSKPDWWHSVEDQFKQSK